MGGAIIFSRAPFLNFVLCDLDAIVQPYLRMCGGPRSAWDAVMLEAPGGTVTCCSSPWAVTT
jgi:hypothetical protein